MWSRVVCSRRAALHSLWRAFIFFGVLRPPAIAGPSGVKRLLENHPAASVKRFHRRFRVNATILVFCVPLFKRPDVGSGTASVEIGASGDQTVTALQFLAGSKPERARGLNRLGLMREAVIERGATLLQTSYAGFITSSPEKSMEQGRGALGASSDMPCVMGTADSVPGRTDATVRHFKLPGGIRWTEAADVVDRMSNTASPDTHRETSAVGPCATFLYAIHRAALEQPLRARRQFWHNAKLHELITEKQPPRMLGSIRDQSGVLVAEFSVWFDPGDSSGIPSYIEFRARSFLRLSFEPEPTSAEIPLPWLIEQRRA
jgi:hypothetical protein